MFDAIDEKESIKSLFGLNYYTTATHRRNAYGTKADMG